MICPEEAGWATYGSPKRPPSGTGFMGRATLNRWQIEVVKPNGVLVVSEALRLHLADAVFAGRIQTMEAAGPVRPLPHTTLADPEHPDMALPPEVSIYNGGNNEI